jgi:hypothetical protein
LIGPLEQGGTKVTQQGWRHQRTGQLREDDQLGMFVLCAAQKAAQIFPIGSNRIMQAHALLHTGDSHSFHRQASYIASFCSLGSCPGVDPWRTIP